ncbi:MAG: hypothetical protein GY715_22125 [Planctomycetes bacterium]|nr:hypothetical protein [Planctomycetota bacterium]
MAKSRVTSLYDLQEKALETAQRLVDYDSYQESETRATSALAKRCDGWSKDECRAWLLKALEVHRDGIACVKGHEDRAWEIHRNGERLADDRIAADFAARHEHHGFPRDLLDGVLGWVFYLYHLR